MCAQCIISCLTMMAAEETRLAEGGPGSGARVTGAEAVEKVSLLHSMSVQKFLFILALFFQTDRTLAPPLFFHRA